MTQEEFEKCYTDYFDAIRNYIFYRCGDPALASDITQDSFIQLWKKNFEYHPQKTKSLLYKIAKDTWITKYRKLIKERDFALTLKFEVSPNKETRENEVENNMLYEELKTQYEKVLSKLTKKNREVFLMSRMENLTYKEISERLNISLKTVEKRMSQTLQILRKKINYD